MWCGVANRTFTADSRSVLTLSLITVLAYVESCTDFLYFVAVSISGEICFFCAKISVLVHKNLAKSCPNCFITSNVECYNDDTT